MKAKFEPMLSTKVAAARMAGAAMMFWIWRYFISTTLHICAPHGHSTGAQHQSAGR